MTAIPQHRQALQNANAKRVGVASLKQRVRAMSTCAGAEYLADVIEHDYADPIIGTARMRQLLVSVRMVGDEKACRCLKAAGVMFYDRRLRDLTARQRNAVALQLRLFATTFRGGS